MPLLARKTTRQPQSAAPLSFDERLQLAGLSTTDTPLNLADVITSPVALPKTQPAPRATPIADLLQQAGHLLATDGWCRGAMRDQDGKRCLYGAIHAAARGNRSAEADAVSIAMDAIRRQFGTDSIPAVNDSSRDIRPIMRIIDAATTLAESRGI